MSDTLDQEFGIRRWYAQVDEVVATESGKLRDGAPLKKIVVAACIRNPFAGHGHVQDLADVINRSPALGLELGRRVLDLLGSETFDSYGKACLVGVAGEYEHGNAFLTAKMMDPLREKLGGGRAWVPSTGKRGGPGSTIDIPLAHRNALYVRSHYDTVTAMFADCPNPDEIVVAFAVATRGRLHARLGGISADQVEGVDGLR